MRRRLVILAGIALACAAGRAGAAPDEALGTYRLTGAGRVEARPFPAREAELHADAVLTGGAGDGEVHLQLRGQGLTCALDGALDGGGRLVLPPGQRCASDVSAEAWDGRMEAKLVSGAGRLQGDELELELSFTVTGEIRMKGGGLLGNLGRRFQLPGTGAGADAMPVSGEGQARAHGRRDRSQAAAR